MSKQITDAKALKLAKALKNGHNWKQLAKWHDDGYYALATDDIGDLPVRLFLTESLFKTSKISSIARSLMPPDFLVCAWS